MTQQKSVIDWLKDAHAMEAGGVVTLSDHAEAAGDYPEVRAKLEEHAAATRRHADLVERRLADLGAKPSSLKEAVGAAFSKVAGVANLPASDTVVKNALGDLAAENFEIASYVSLIAAAEEIGDRETAAVCEQILRDEEMMADWLKAQIPAITRQFLARQADDQGGAAGGGLLEGAKGAAQGLGERVKAAAPDAGDTRNALLVSGALLAGAGAALLVGKALAGGSGDQGKNAEAADVPQYPSAEPAAAAVDAGAYAAPSDLGSEVGDLSGGAGLGEGSPDAAPAVADPLDETVMLSETVEVGTLEVPGQDEVVIETLSEDARFLMASDPVADPVVALDEVPGTSATDLPDEPQTDADVPGTETAIWLVPGPYSGLGPVSYDAGDPLGQDVYSRLAQHGHVDATHIEIVIDGGEVLLEGSVDSETTKRMAEEAVRNVAGVEQVQNLLQVRDSLN